MTNIERQKSLDKKKWIASERAGTDQSGKMLWCDSCKYGTRDFKCEIGQAQREKECACARAYNAMKRK